LLDASVAADHARLEQSGSRIKRQIRLARFARGLRARAGNQ
jgi:hypothetical protein